MIRTAASIVLYHGTATGDDDEILRRILKQGIIPDPKQKAYESPYEGDEDFYESRYDSIEDELDALLNEGLGGAYFTDTIHTAMTFAEGNTRIVFGGEPVLIAARIETRSPEVRLDEDAFINYIWGFATESFESENDDAYYLELWDWLDDGIASKWEEIGRRWIAKNYADVGIPAHRWDRIVEPLGKAVHGMLIHTFLANYRDEAEDAAREYDPDHWILDMDWVDTMISAANRYKDNIAIVAEELREPARTVSPQREHRLRMLEPVTYRGANRILAIISWDRDERVGTVYYAHDTAAAERMINAVGTRFWRWQWSDGEVIVESAS